MRGNVRQRQGTGTSVSHERARRDRAGAQFPGPRGLARWRNRKEPRAWLERKEPTRRCDGRSGVLGSWSRRAWLAVVRTQPFALSERSSHACEADEKSDRSQGGSAALAKTLPHLSAADRVKEKPLHSEATGSPHCCPHISPQRSLLHPLPVGPLLFAPLGEHARSGVFPAICMLTVARCAHLY